MKIVFAVKALDDIKGGAERVLADVASALAQRGHDVVVVSYDRPGGQSFYPMDGLVRRKTLGIGETQKRATVRETLQRIWSLRKAIVAEKPDAVIGFMHSMFIPLAFAIAGTGLPVIGSEHIVPDHYKTRRTEFFLFLLASFFMKRVTVLSEEIRKSYPFPIRKKMVVVPNPVTQPADHELPANRYGSPYIILNVGRLDPQKDQETLIRAFARLAPDFPDWKVRIVGDGDLRPHLQSVIDALDLRPRIVLAGTTPYISSEYKRAHIFALPSVYESFGLATAEAMSYALPAIGFADCPGTNELIADGQNGHLVAGDDRVLAFAEGLRVLMSDPALRDTLGKAARSSVEKYAPGHIVDRWEDLIRAV